MHYFILKLIKLTLVHFLDIFMKRNDKCMLFKEFVVYHFKDGLLLLTSSSWGHPLSALWSMDKFFDQKAGFVDDQYMEFSKCVQDRIIGTADTKANVSQTYNNTPSHFCNVLTLYSSIGALLLCPRSMSGTGPLEAEHSSTLPNEFLVGISAQSVCWCCR